MISHQHFVGDVSSILARAFLKEADAGANESPYISEKRIKNNSNIPAQAFCIS
jgi:hypothetical protein